DEAHLRQAVANLMSNAVSHTPPGTPIDVHAELSNGTATVRVRDHGSGLDETALAHVFDRFWQADRARAGTGAGLGLAIVAAIATEHGGTASATNVDNGTGTADGTENAGAEFTLTLPLT